MDDAMLAERFENIDRRLDRVEQILPTLATKEDVKPLATKQELGTAVARLATKEELSAAVARLATKKELAAAVATLATKQELQEEGERLRRHMDVLTESLRDDVQLIAAHVASSAPKRNEP